MQQRIRRTSPFNLPLARRRRAGSIYVLVLGMGTLLAVAGISMLTLSRISARNAAMTNDSAEASVLAESAVEAALLTIANDANWRADYTNNVESAPKSLGHGTISFKLVDETDGNLSNNSTDAVRIYGIGRVNKATRVYSVRCAPRGMTSLSDAMCFGQAIIVGGITVLGTGTISSNSLITATGTAWTGTNLEASGLVTTLLCSGSGARKSLVPVKEMPNSSTVFNYYATNGTAMSGVPKSSGVYQVNRALISPSNNPFSGGTNARGIYYFDCGGSSVTITDSRIVGTLVLRNCGGLTIQGAVNCEPAVVGYPVFMVDGTLNWKATSSVLMENASPVVNFNPAGTPYPYSCGANTGASNATTTDTYPNQISGLIYVANALTTSAAKLNSGVLICGGAWNNSGTISLTFDGTCYSNPAPGFTSAAMGPLSGTWQWEQAP